MPKRRLMQSTGFNLLERTQSNLDTIKLTNETDKTEEKLERVRVHLILHWILISDQSSKSTWGIIRYARPQA